MRSITIDPTADYVRDVKFTKIGNGPVLRVGKLMQAVGATIGSKGKAYRVKGGIFIAIEKPATAQEIAGKPRFERMDYKSYMASFEQGTTRLTATSVPLVGREIP